MKNLLVLILFLFVTVCYAAPPPDPVPVTDFEVTFVVDQHQVTDVTVFKFEAREVAFVYLGDSEVLTGTVVNDEAAMKIEAAKLPEVLSTTNLIALNKPPALLIDDEGGTNTKAFLNDRQHSNYGYPFTAN